MILGEKEDDKTDKPTCAYGKSLNVRETLKPWKCLLNFVADSHAAIYRG